MFFYLWSVRVRKHKRGNVLWLLGPSSTMTRWRTWDGISRTISSKEVEDLRQDAEALEYENNVGAKREPVLVSTVSARLPQELILWQNELNTIREEGNSDIPKRFTGTSSKTTF